MTLEENIEKEMELCGEVWQEIQESNSDSRNYHFSTWKFSLGVITSFGGLMICRYFGDHRESAYSMLAGLNPLITFPIGITLMEIEIIKYLFYREGLKTASLCSENR